MKHAKFLKNAAILSLAGILAKGIGALYRIPLTSALGGYGTGLYQMAYPLFCVLLTFSSAGVPTALSRMIAAEKGEVMGSALRLFSLLGLVGALVMALLAPVMSGIQGDAALTPCYLALAPSVFFVALIAVLRGCFQGKNDMRPTALSEILEQLVKAGAGLLITGLAADPARRAAYALFAVTLSEAAALLFLLLRYRGTKRVLLARKRSGFSVLRGALPVMAASALLPISRMADSILVVRLLFRFTDRSVSLYGLFAGAAVSLCSLPATLCYGVAAAAVPAVSRGQASGEEEGKRRALYALLLTLLLSLPLSLLLFAFAGPVVKILYPALSLADRETLISLVRLTSLSSVFLSGVDTLTASLTGMGRAKQAACSMAVAVGVKTVLECLLINRRFLILGAAAAANACYPIAFFLDLLYTVRKRKVTAYDRGDRLGNGKGRSDAERAERASQSGQRSPSHGTNSRRGDLKRGGDPI